MRSISTCSTPLWVAVLLLNAALGTADGTTASSRQERQVKEEIDPKCLPTVIDNLRYVADATQVTLAWKQVTEDHSCTRHGAKYSVIITWTPKGEELKEDEIAPSGDHYVISGLKPYTPLEIKVWLRYLDENGDEHGGPPRAITPRTAVSKPSLPKNFKISQFKQDDDRKLAVTAVWDAPDVLNGPLDGYVYQICPVKTCNDNPGTHCREDRIAPEKSFTVSGVRPLERYWVWLAGYNEDPTKDGRDKKVVGEYIPFCFRMPPVDLEPTRDFNVQCTPSPNTVTVTWKLPFANDSVPEGYRVEITGGLAGLEKVTHEVNIQTSCHEECSYSVGGGKGGDTYSLTLFPHYEDVGTFGLHIDKRECVMPESEPPPPTKEIKLVADASLNKTEQAFEFSISMFSDENGKITTTEWLIAQDSQIDKCGAPVTWKEAHSQDPISCYVVKFDTDDPPACKTVNDVRRCVIGTEKECEGHGCNGQLKVGVKYGIKLRGYNSKGHADSKAAFFTAGSPPPSSSGKIGGSFIVIFAVMSVKALMVQAH
ncbi:uncharacterized protein LOC135385248 [Ornithodoros turicata]|uniref:uncharacterized protein LOC135385248 n=1 Tax=Ornithodoros turicata TaxID=34597 RepID=UPI003139399C